MKIKLGILDFKSSNMKSLFQMFNKLNFNIDIIIIKNKTDLLKIDKLIIPGQSTSKSCILYFYLKNILQNLIKFINEKPILAICAGKQILFEYSYENYCSNLNLFKGKSTKFSNKNNFKIPYIGWNKVNIIKNHYLFKKINNFNNFYFSHSYYIDNIEFSNIYAISKYFIKFPSILIKNNIIATQFHPEKSSYFGFKLCNNFLKWNP